MLSRSRTFPVARSPEAATPVSLDALNTKLLSLNLAGSRAGPELPGLGSPRDFEQRITVTDQALRDWDVEIRKFTTDEERASFFEQVKNVKSFASYVQAVEKNIKDSNKSSKTLKVAKWIMPIFKTLNMIAPTAINYAPIDPRMSGIVLGAITNALSLSSKYVDFQKGLEQMISDMATKLDFVGQYGDSMFPKDLKLRKALIQIYVVVLKFCVDASRLFTRDNGKKKLAILRLGVSALESFESRYGEVKLDFRTRLEDFKLAVGICRDQAILNLGRSQKAAMDLAVQASSALQLKFEEDRRRDNLKQIKERMAARTAKRNELLDRLPWDSFREIQEQRFPNIIMGTGQWLIDSDEYQTWMKGTHSSLLWVHGKHGSGKSFVACRTIEDLNIMCELRRGAAESNTDLVALAYVYCSSIIESDNDPRRLLGSMFKQLLEQLPSSADVANLYTELGSKRDTATTEDIKSGIRIVSAWFSETFLVFDGLDECSNRVGAENAGFVDLCEFIASLSTTALPKASIKTLVFSRPGYSQIKDAFTAKGCKEIQADSGSNATDVEEYISQMTENLTRNAQILTQIKEKLLSESDGMFLWVKLFISVLREECVTARDMQKAIQDLPQSLGEVYQRSLERVTRQPKRIKQRALKAILWITNAKRSLSRTEMEQVLAIDNDMTDWDDSFEPERETSLVNQCGDLITLMNDRYSLVHSSLKEFLVDPKLAFPEYQKEQANHSFNMAETCLIMLNFETFRVGSDMTAEERNTLVQKHPFLTYSSAEWGHHLEAVDKDDCDELDALALQFLSHSRSRNLAMQCKIEVDYPGQSVPLHVLSTFNIVRLAEALENGPDQQKEYDGFNMMPIDYAVQFKNHEMAMWLLESHTTAIEDSMIHIPRAETREPRILICAQWNWFDAIIILCQLGEDPDDRNDNNMTALHMAAWHGGIDAVNTLLSLGANINAVGSWEQTPIATAAIDQQWEVTLRLVNAGADLNARFHLADMGGLTVLHLAAYYNMIEVVKALVLKGADIDALTDKKESPLYYAASEGHPSVVKYLLASGASSINTQTTEGLTCLLAAATTNSKECVKILLEAGADVTIEDNTKMNCVHYVAMKGDIEQLELLAAYKAPFEHVDMAGSTPLYTSIGEGRLDMAKALIQQFKCDPAYIVDEKHNALHITAANLKDGSAPEFLSFLLGLGLDPKSRMKEGFTPLHNASYNNNKVVAEALLRIDASLCRETAENGVIPLHSAAAIGDLETLKLLLRYDSSLKSAADNENTTPLHMAVVDGHLDCVKLLATPENINAQGSSQRTPLHFACENGHMSTIEFLVQSGAQLTALDEEGVTPVMVAVSNKNIDLAIWLLDHGADPKGKVASSGSNALVMSLDLGSLALINKILDCGGEPLILQKGFLGINAFMVAAGAGRVDILDLFLQRGYDGSLVRSDVAGMTCIHLALVKGQVEVIDRLLTLHPASRMLLDDSRRDLMQFSASIGQLPCMLLLLKLGLPLGGLKVGMGTSLHEAVAGGAILAVNFLLRHGADINETLPLPWALRPLHLASRSPRVAARLLEAGADPWARDLLGRTAMTIADGHVRQIISYFLHRTTAQVDNDHVATTQNSITLAISMLYWILHTPEPFCASQDMALVYRCHCIIALAQLLMHMGSAAAISEARMLLSEIYSMPEGDRPSYFPHCCLCSEIFTAKKAYVCLKCYTYVCEPCAEDACGPRTLAKRQKTLLALESKVYAVRTLFSYFWQDAMAVVLGIENIEELPSCWAVVEELDEAYEAWHEEFNASKEEFDTSNAPGWGFLKMIRKVFSDAKENDWTKVNLMDFCSNVSNELKTFFVDNTPHIELMVYECHQHQLLEVSVVSAMSESECGNFDQDNRLKDDFFKAMLERYTDLLVSETGESYLATIKTDSGEPNTCLASLPFQSEHIRTPVYSDLENTQQSITKIEPNTLRWWKTEDEYLDQLKTDFTQLQEYRRKLLDALKRVYSEDPMGRRFVSRESTCPYGILHIDMDSPSYPPLSVITGLEMTWQFCQLVCMGFVSTTLTDQLEAESNSHALPESTAATTESTATTTDNDAATADNTAATTENQQSALRAPDRPAITDSFLDKLPDDIRNEITTFVLGARNLKDNPEQMILTLENPEGSSPVVKAYLRCRYMVYSAPFVLYDFYSNPVLSRLIYQR